MKICVASHPFSFGAVPSYSTAHIKRAICLHLFIITKRWKYGSHLTHIQGSEYLCTPSPFIRAICLQFFIITERRKYASHFTPFSFGAVHWNKHRSHKEGNLLAAFHYNKIAEICAASHPFSFGAVPSYSTAHIKRAICLHLFIITK